MTTIYEKLIYPLLRQMDAETAHDRTLDALERAQKMPAGRAALRALAGSVPRQPVYAFGLVFPNVLGMAAGFDKDVRVAVGLACLGFGHVEVGTLTPNPQAGNPKPRVFRLVQDEALINRLGFPNSGVRTAVPRLQALATRPLDFVLGVSLGKQKETPLAEAAADYITVMRAVYSCADYLAVNVSSPNTPGLRELQGGDYLGRLLGALQAENAEQSEKHRIRQRPLLVKIAPDLTWPELDAILDASLAQGVAGIIATNTTLDRAGLRDPKREESGGLSGRPLTVRSNEIISYIARQVGSRLPIIGVGGVRSADDVRAKLDAGAVLVQLYTGLVYGGPRLPGRILRNLTETRPR